MVFKILIEVRFNWAFFHGEQQLTILMARAAKLDINQVTFEGPQIVLKSKQKPIPQFIRDSNVFRFD